MVLVRLAISRRLVPAFDHKDSPFLVVEIDQDLAVRVGKGSSGGSSKGDGFSKEMLGRIGTLETRLI